MKINLAYATEKEQIIVELEVPAGISVRQAIEHSGLLRRFPEINLSAQKVGIFGEIVKLNTLVKAGDRIEIYRPLQMDPKQARLLRAAKPLRSGVHRFKMIME